MHILLSLASLTVVSHTPQIVSRNSFSVSAASSWDFEGSALEAGEGQKSKTSKKKKGFLSRTDNYQQLPGDSCTYVACNFQTKVILLCSLMHLLSVRSLQASIYSGESWYSLLIVFTAGRAHCIDSVHTHSWSIDYFEKIMTILEHLCHHIPAYRIGCSQGGMDGGGGYSKINVSTFAKKGTGIYLKLTSHVVW